VDGARGGAGAGVGGRSGIAVAAGRRGGDGEKTLAGVRSGTLESSGGEGAARRKPMGSGLRFSPTGIDAECSAVRRLHKGKATPAEHSASIPERLAAREVL
jgi:hypothetical protein